MKYWIGVVGSKGSYSTLEEGPPWFCLPVAAIPGDMVLLYATKLARGVKSGIFAAYEVEKKDPERDRYCRKYGRFHHSSQRLSFTELKLIFKFANPIDFQELKSSVELANSVFVRRNMQATFFEISAREYETIRRLQSCVFSS